MLIIDDEASFREALALYLIESRGCRVLQAEDGRQGLALFLSERPELVLVDLRMPVMDGIEVLDAMRESDPETPAIVISGTVDLKDAILAIRHGAWDFVAKPILDMAVLDQALDSALDRKRMFKQSKLRQMELESEVSKRTSQLLHTQEQLEEHSNFLDRLLESVPSPLFYKNMQGRVLGCNKKFADLFGCQVTDLIGRTANEFFSENDAALLGRIQRADDEVFRNQGEFSYEDHLIDKNGQKKYFSICKTVFSDSHGQPLGLIGTYHDITQHKQLEEKLIANETDMRRLLESLPNGILEMDVSGTIIYANSAMESMCNYRSGEMVGINIQDLAVDNEDRSRVCCMLVQHDDAHHGYISVQVKQRCKDGDVIDVQMDWNCAHETVSGIKTYIASVTNITDRKRAEEALRQSEETLREILLGIKAGIMVVDPSTMAIVDVNSVAAEILGSPREEILGKSYGEMHWLQDNGRQYAERCAYPNNGPWNEELRIRRPDGRIVPVTRTVVSAARDGRRLSYMIIFDLTQRKVLERQLVQAQRLESIGALASGIAHEINTPIQYIGDNLTFLEGAFANLTATLRRCREQSGLKDGKDSELEYLMSESPRAVSDSLQGVARVATIVSAMKRFAHPGSEERMPLDVNKAIETTVEVARNEWKYHAEVKLDLDPNLEFFPCYAGDFNQVILNMLVNAAHAVNDKYQDNPDKGLITIRTQKAGSLMTVSISDTGCGIPPENLHRIYDPFFTTKEVGKGTGQGLAIAHDIVVNKHGGTIDVESEPGIGTTFTLRFPLFHGVKASQ